VVAMGGGAAPEIAGCMRTRLLPKVDHVTLWLWLGTAALIRVQMDLMGACMAAADNAMAVCDLSHEMHAYGCVVGKRHTELGELPGVVACGVVVGAAAGAWPRC